jgi:hypothetical protein
VIIGFHPPFAFGGPLEDGSRVLDVLGWAYVGGPWAVDEWPCSVICSLLVLPPPGEGSVMESLKASVCCGLICHVWSIRRQME